MTAKPITNVPLFERDLPEPHAPAPAACDLGRIARDASLRAARLLHDSDPGPSDPVIDLVRLLAGCTDTAITRAAATPANLRPGELGRLRTAYTYGGVHGVHTALHTTAPSPQTLQTAAESISHHRPRTAAALRTEHNHVTDDDAGLQVRYGPDHRWYPYVFGHGTWAPAPHPSSDPAHAYRFATMAKRNRA